MTIAPAAWPHLGVGCATLAAPQVSEHDAAATLAQAIDRGVRFFDVAPLYGGGLGEERLGRALRGLPRDDYVLCTKTGVTRPYAQAATPPGTATPRAADRWDYSRGATRASVQRSLERLGVDRLDVVHLHDVDNHVEACLEAHAELAQLQAEGVVGAIGIGSNLVAPVATLLARAPFQAFLLAGRYTLLDASAAGLFAQAQRQGVAVIAGGIFNSGILGRWPQPAPTYDYRPASAAEIGRTARIAAVCARHGVALPTAALQFAASHPAVRTVLIGPRSPDEVDASLAAMHVTIDPALWHDLAAEGLVARTGLARAAETAAS